jgi:hypothetical protein
MTINLPFTPDLFAVSRRIVWFEEPETALQNPTRFIAHAMRYVTHPDMQIIRQEDVTSCSASDYRLPLMGILPREIGNWSSVFASSAAFCSISVEFWAGEGG